MSIGQDSLTTVSIHDLRRSAILIIEGDECKDVLSIKVAQIENKQAQIEQLEAILYTKDSVIYFKDQISANKDSIVLEKITVIEGKDKEIKKLKRKNTIIIIGSVAVKVLMILVMI